MFVAKFDYEKEREDLLSFKEGEKFRIASKADKKWWAAYSVETGDYGYVPSSYMEVGYREIARVDGYGDFLLTRRKHECCDIRILHEELLF